MTEQRKIAGDKLLDLGNYTAVALTFGQLATSNKDASIIVIGIGITVVFWLIGLMILRDSKKKGGK